AGLARHDLPRPALRHRLEKIDAALTVVGEDDVELTVLVDVDETQAGVAALLVDKLGAFRQFKGERLWDCRPGDVAGKAPRREDGRDSTSPDDGLRSAIAIDIPEL